MRESSRRRGEWVWLARSGDANGFRGWVFTSPTGVVDAFRRAGLTPPRLPTPWLGASTNWICCSAGLRPVSFRPAWFAPAAARRVLPGMLVRIPSEVWIVPGRNNWSIRSDRRRAVLPTLRIQQEAACRADDNVIDIAESALQVMPNTPLSRQRRPVPRPSTSHPRNLVAAYRYRRVWPFLDAPARNTMRHPRGHRDRRRMAGVVGTQRKPDSRR